VGVKPVVVALIAQAVWSLGKTVLKSRELAVIAAIVLGLAALKVSTLPLLIGTGVAWIVANRFGAKPAAGRGGRNYHRSGAAATFAAATTTGVFLYFLKIGALLFGSGYVLLAVLREDLVLKMHWLSETQLLDGIAVSQATPGPFLRGDIFWDTCFRAGGARGWRR